MRYIFGLGNPGRKYRDTRHNVGFMVADLLANRHNISFRNHPKLECYMGSGDINGERVRLIKPDTFMNHSGWAASAVMDYFGADTQDMIVLYDDIDIALGTLRIRERGSAGTHNGMRSIVEYLQTQDFMRVRIGIGRPRYDLTSYVMGRFGEDEREVAQEAIARAADAVECLVVKGLQPAQEKYQNLKIKENQKEEE